MAGTLAEAVVPDGFRCRYNTTYMSKPSMWLPCAWGTIRALRRFAAIPATKRSPAVEDAIHQGIQFPLSHDLAEADYPTAYGVSPLCSPFGFPLGYASNLLAALSVLARPGFGRSPRLANAISLVLYPNRMSKEKWALKHTPGQTWAKFEEKGRPENERP